MDQLVGIWRAILACMKTVTILAVLLLMPTFAFADSQALQQLRIYYPGAEDTLREVFLRKGMTEDVVEWNLDRQARAIFAFFDLIDVGIADPSDAFVVTAHWAFISGPEYSRALREDIGSREDLAAQIPINWVAAYEELKYLSGI